MKVFVCAFNLEKALLVGASHLYYLSIAFVDLEQIELYNEIFVFGNLLIHSVHLQCHLL